MIQSSDWSAYRSNRLDRIKKVGVQRPTKMLNSSAWFLASGVGADSPWKNQMAIEPRTEANPRMKLKLLNILYVCERIMLFG